MATVVEHDKRKEEILEKALDVFINEGYEDVTFQKIADRCGITRTTLYIYFKNKREIFLWSIKLLTKNLEKELMATIKDESISCQTQLRTVTNKVIDCCQENYKLFIILLPYLQQIIKAGESPAERIKRRVIKIRHFLSFIIIKGIDNGEFKKMNIHNAIEVIYGLIESTIFKLVLLNQTNISDMKEVINVAIDGLINN